MQVLKIYITVNEFSDYIKSRISEEDQEKFSDCTMIPLLLELKEDMTIQATIVGAKNGECDPENVAYRLRRTS